jgi:hypothetical protein
MLLPLRGDGSSFMDKLLSHTMASPRPQEEDEDAFNWGEDVDATELAAGNVDADDLEDWAELEDRTTPEPAVVSVPDSGQSSAEFESPQEKAVHENLARQVDEAEHADSSPQKAVETAPAQPVVTAQTAVHQSEIEAEEQPAEPAHSAPKEQEQETRERQGSSGGWGLRSAWGLGAIGGLAKAVAGVATGEEHACIPSILNIIQSQGMHELPCCVLVYAQRLCET